jgi:hypothetical protein
VIAYTAPNPYTAYAYMYVHMYAPTNNMEGETQDRARILQSFSLYTYNQKWYRPYSPPQLVIRTFKTPYKYQSPSTIVSAEGAKPALRFGPSDVSVISPHMIPSGGKSVNLQHDAKTTLAEPAMTGIGDRCGKKYMTVIARIIAVHIHANTNIGEGMRYNWMVAPRKEVL